MAAEVSYIVPIRGPMGLKGEKQPKAKRQRAEHSGAVRKSAKGEECSLRLPCCARDPATTIFAHLRLFGAGGTGLKPADFAGIYACHLCHDALDRSDGATAGLWGFEDVLRALMETHRRLHAKGLLHIG